jgi:L-fucose mutarotase/ribose pyranase (RbsD/FucU family)
MTLLRGLHPLLHRGAFAIVRTAELPPYGTILLVAGVVNEYPSR